MIQFLKKHPQYNSLYLLFGFFLFVIVWFSAKGPQAQQSVNAKGSSASPIALDGDFTPDASNVTHSTTKQLNDLRMHVALEPEDTTHVVRLARMLRDAHQVEEATTYFAQYLDVRPANRQAWLDFAQSLGELKRWEDAQEATESLLAQYPDDPSGLYNLGAIYANQARIDEARQIWTTLAAQTADPTVADMAKSSLNRLNSFLKP